ncbi:MAG: hypothetical protein Rhob2KO_04650 [Rhodopirellula baltica]
MGGDGRWIVGVRTRNNWGQLFDSGSVEQLSSTVPSGNPQVSSQVATQAIPNHRFEPGHGG